MPTATTIRTLKSFPASESQVHTSMTGLRTVSWRNWNYLNSVNQSFVHQILAKLEKSPGIRASSLSFRSRLLVGSFSNTSQIFNGLALKK